MLAFLYVLLHHTVMGVLAPASVYDHGEAGPPVQWAGVHAASSSAPGHRQHRHLAAERGRARGRARCGQRRVPLRVRGRADRHGARRPRRPHRARQRRLCRHRLTGHEGQEPGPRRPLRTDDSRARWRPRRGDEVERRSRAPTARSAGACGGSPRPRRRRQPAYWARHAHARHLRAQGGRAQLDYQAHHDPLTGLPNRTLFTRAARRGAGRRRTHASPCCSSTSTTSRSSTTRSATRAGDGCSTSSPSACAARCAPAT